MGKEMFLFSYVFKYLNFRSHVFWALVLQGHKEWVTEVNVLGVVEHPNLVKLLGYCAEDDERGIQRLLIYEYMPNRSVQDHLSSRFQLPLPWATRMKIAQDAARGLAYLHEGMEFQVLLWFFLFFNCTCDDFVREIDKECRNWYWFVFTWGFVVITLEETTTASVAVNLVNIDLIMVNSNFPFYFTNTKASYELFINLGDIRILQTLILSPKLPP